MKRLFLLLSTIAVLALFSCKKEDNSVTPAPTATTVSSSKTLKLVVTSTATQSDISFKPTNSTGNWLWTETFATGSFERNVTAEKDSSILLFVTSRNNQHAYFTLKVYEDGTLVDEQNKACTFSFLEYKVE